MLGCLEAAFTVLSYYQHYFCRKRTVDVTVLSKGKFVRVT